MSSHSYPPNRVMLLTGLSCLLAATQAIPLPIIASRNSEHKFDVSALQFLPRSNDVEANLFDSVVEAEISFLQAPTPTSMVQGDIAIASAAILIESTNSPVSSPSSLPVAPCPLAVTLRSDGWQLYAFPVVTLTLLSCTFVTLICFVVYFFVWRWRFRRDHLSPIKMKSPLNKKNLAISVQSRDSKVHHSSQPLHAISEDSLLATPTPQTPRPYGRPFSPVPPYTVGSGSRIALPDSPVRSSSTPLTLPLTPNRLDKKPSFLSMKG